MEIINVHIYEPDSYRGLFKSPKNAKAECHIYSCANKNNCELYAQNKCILLDRSIFSSSSCPYGKFNKEIGPTQRAISFGPWIRSRQEKYAGLLDVISGDAKKIASVGEYVYFPYSRYDGYETFPIWPKGAHKKFIKKELFTAEFIISLCNRIPRTLFENAEIKDYQKEIIPSFLLHLKEVMTDLFEDVIKLAPELKWKLPKTNVGRRAFLRTLLPNVGHVTLRLGDDVLWRWTGTHLETDSGKAVMFLPSHTESFVRIVPTPELTMFVGDDAQVGPNTQFED